MSYTTKSMRQKEKEREEGPYDMDRNIKTANRAKQAGRWVAICLFWLALWQGAALLVRNSLLLPSPAETLAALVALLGQKAFYLQAAWTIFRCLLAMLLSLAAGTVCA